MYHFCILLFVVLCCSVVSAAEKLPPTHTDESKVPTFTLPDPLVMRNGQKVSTAEQWKQQRRPELLQLFTEQMFGTLPIPTTHSTPPGTIGTAYKFPGENIVFDGKGTRHQWTLTIQKPLNISGTKTLNGQTGKDDNDKPDEHKINLLLYTPNNVKGNVPVFIGLNFQGNHTVNADPGIVLGTVWQDGKPVLADEKERGKQARRWEIETLLERGYAVATVYYEDIEPDFNGGSQFGVRRFIEQKGEPSDSNAIATWAWGCSMILNVLQAEKGLNVDCNKAIVIGHSRLGKTALWAGAMDERFAMVISNDSGCGGAALSRRAFGETVARINTVFPHWFCGNFKKYDGKENDLPFDQHELIALIAPRPVYVASASKDLWADPKGEFLSALYADPVYRLLGTEGMGNVKEQPGVNQSVGERIRYHLREGEHDILEFDWLQYLDFADKYLR